jgi:hypothetical protein
MADPFRAQRVGVLTKNTDDLLPIHSVRLAQFEQFDQFARVTLTRANLVLQHLVDNPIR